MLVVSDHEMPHMIQCPQIVVRRRKKDTSIHPTNLAPISQLKTQTPIKNLILTLTRKNVTANKKSCNKIFHILYSDMDQKTTKKQNPSEFLRQIIGKPVVVKLNSGVDYRGVLACLDGYMNIALEQTEEYVNGQVGIPFIV